MAYSFHIHTNRHTLNSAYWGMCVWLCTLLIAAVAQHQNCSQRSWLEACASYFLFSTDWNNCSCYKFNWGALWSAEKYAVTSGGDGRSGNNCNQFDSILWNCSSHWWQKLFCIVLETFTNSLKVLYMRAKATKRTNSHKRLLHCFCIRSKNCVQITGRCANDFHPFFWFLFCFADIW